MRNNMKMSKRICSGISLIVVFVMIGVLLFDIDAFATVVRIGTVVNTDEVNFRTGAGKEFDSIKKLKKGESGEIIGEKTASNGRLWYQMVVDNVTGWASSSYIKVTEKNTDVDPEFEEYLKKQGFPESYREQLHVLHKKYPNWQFEAQKVDYDWDYVIEKESALGQNLVATGSVASWKSTQDGAYNWETGKWIGLDGSSWVAASQEIIEHYMDPRNFLDSTYVFQFLKQSYDASALTPEQLDEKKDQLLLVVDGTYLAGNYLEEVQETEQDKEQDPVGESGQETIQQQEISYGDTIMSVAASTGVDPLTLASMMIQEQGVKGTGESISGTVAGYEGYYNYFNIGAYATSTMSAVERGLWYAKGSGSNATSYNRPWNTRTASIMGGASYYGKNYVDVGQDTMYLKKFNVQGSKPFTHQYMTNVQGAASEGKHVADGYNETSRQAKLVFKIPVYKNMPEKPCERPTENKDPNYVLKSLSVTGHSLTPTFSYDETSYSVTVPYETSSITISAAAVSSKTKIVGIGEKKLVVGPNSFKIETTAENGSTGTYTIKIIRKEGTPILDSNYALKSLSVSGHSLTPTFSSDKTSYFVTVPNEISRVTISATAVSSKTKITGVGEKKLEVGTNIFKVETTAENGSTGTYAIKIIRKEGTPILDSNYALKSLSVSGHSLTPTFSSDKTSYSVTVPNETSSVTIFATAVSSKTKITGTGEKKLEVGPNTFKVETTAENGSKGTYTIKITRKEAETVQPELSFQVTDYKLNDNKTITGIKKFPITASDFKKKFTVKNGSIKVVSAKGEDVTGNVGTGCQVKVYDTAGKLKHTYTVVIYGDTNGDGKVTQLDLLRIQKNILGISKLSGANMTAGDTSKDGKINALDLLQVQKQLLNIKAIQQ